MPNGLPLTLFALTDDNPQVACVMPYHLEPAEAFSGSVNGIAVEELGGAAEGSRNGFDEGNTAHDTRERFEKTRALLRLVRRDLAGETVRQANLLLRDAGRDLSGRRDAYVLSETLAALAGRVPDETHREAFEGCGRRCGQCGSRRHRGARPTATENGTKKVFERVAAVRRSTGQLAERSRRCP